VERSRVRSQPARVLLRTRAGNSDAALDTDSSREIGPAPTDDHAAHRAGTFSQNFTAEGETIVFRVGSDAVLPSGFGNVERGGHQGLTSSYEIEGGKLITLVSQDPYSVAIYKLGDTYYGARTNEFGYANYQIIPTPQIAANALVALSNQFSLGLALTQPQQRQIATMLKATIRKLTALKTDTSVTGVRKIEQLKQVADAFIAEVEPLLNAEQQQKFDGLRNQLRERVLEGAGASAIEKAERAIRTFRHDLSPSHKNFQTRSSLR
jgi:hypothetical protein